MKITLIKHFQSSGECRKFIDDMDTTTSPEANANYWMLKHGVTAKELHYHKVGGGMLDEVSVMFECDSNDLKIKTVKFEGHNTTCEVWMEGCEFERDIKFTDIIAYGWDGHDYYIMYLPEK